MLFNYKLFIPLKEYLINKEINKYKNNELSTIFNYAELSGIADDIIIKLDHTLDDKHLLNLFRKSFHNKCTDLYRKFGLYKKNKQPLPLLNIDIAIDNTDESNIEFIDYINNLAKIIPESNLKNDYIKLIHLLINNETHDNILAILGISSSTLSRRKNYLKKLFGLKHHSKIILSKKEDKKIKKDYTLCTSEFFNIPNNYSKIVVNLTIIKNYNSKETYKIYEYICKTKKDYYIQKEMIKSNEFKTFINGKIQKYI